MITCDQALELLSAQLDGAITIEEQTALQEHLAACPECRRIQSELKMAEEALPKLQQEPPKLLHDTVMREIRRETRRKKERKPLLRFVGAMAAAAALLAVLAGFKLVNRLDGRFSVPEDGQREKVRGGALQADRLPRHSG